jgi:hypothetical protein
MVPHTSILHIVVPLWWWGCRARRMEVVAQNLLLQSLKFLTCSLHSRWWRGCRARRMEVILHIVVPLWWRGCRARRLEVVALNLLLQSLKSLTCSLHSRLPTLLTWAEIRSLRERTNTKPCVASLRSSALHLPFVFHDSSSVFQD